MYSSLSSILKNDQELESQSSKSAQSENMNIKPEIAEHRQHEQMIRERKNRYQHIICAVVQDKSTQKYQSFIRGEAITVLNNCTVFWDGEKVAPLMEKSRDAIKALVA